MSEMNLNLLPSRAKFQASKILWNSRVNKFMVWLTFLWVIIIGVVLVTNFVVLLMKKNADSKLALAKSEYSLYDLTIQNNQRLKYKAKLVGEVLASRFEYSKAFKGATDFFPEGITMDKFTLGDDKVLKLEGTAKDIDLDKVEKQVEYVNDGRSSIYKKAKISSLSWNNGFWKFTVEVNL